MEPVLKLFLSCLKDFWIWLSLQCVAWFPEYTLQKVESSLLREKTASNKKYFKNLLLLETSKYSLSHLFSHETDLIPKGYTVPGNQSTYEKHNHIWIFFQNLNLIHNLGY